MHEVIGCIGKFAFICVFQLHYWLKEDSLLCILVTLLAEKKICQTFFLYLHTCVLLGFYEEVPPGLTV